MADLIINITFNYWSGQQDSNLRPHAPQACTLPGCAMPRTDVAINHSM